MYIVHAALEITPSIPLQCGPGSSPWLSIVPLSDRQGGDRTPPLYVLDLQISCVRSVRIITIACRGNNPINAQSTPQTLQGK